MKTVTYCLLALAALVVGSLSFAAVAAASTFVAGAPAGAAATSSPDGISAILDLLRPVYDAFAHGSYLYAGALVLVLAVALTKRYLGPKVPWLHSDAGNSSLTLVGAFAASTAAALAGGGGFTTAILWSALGVAVTAAGGYMLLLHLLVPTLQKWAAKAPAWAQPVFALVLWVFNRPDPVAVAVAAGDAAVAAKPSTGIAGVIGKPTDVK